VHLSSITDFYKKAKRQYINFSLFNAAPLTHYARHLLSFLMFYSFGKGKAPDPLNITVDLNYNCNLNCPFCFLHSSDSITQMEAKPCITLGDMEKFLAPLRGKPTTFLLTGGEPTLRKDLTDIVMLIKEYKFRCGLFTNATLLKPSMSDDLIRSGLDYLLFSLDGPLAIHDALREEGAFKNTCENIRYIVNTRKQKSPRIIMNVVILPENYVHLEEIIDIALDLGVDGISLGFPTFLTTEEFSVHKTELKKHFSVNDPGGFIHVNNFSKGEMKNLPSIIRSALSYAKEKNLKIFLKPDPNEKDMAKWFDSDFKFLRQCIYPWNVMRISPYGDIYPCAQFPVKMGNIRISSIKEIWNGEKFVKFRTMLRREGLFTGCNRCCKL